MEAYENQEVPFEKVVEAVLKDRDKSRSPLFQVLLDFHNTPQVSELKFGNLGLSQKNYENKIAKFELTFFIKESNEGLIFSIQYSTDLYSNKTVERMAVHLKELISSIVKDPKQKVGKLNMLSEAEKSIIITGFNNTKKKYQRKESVIELFEKQVKSSPDNVAVVYENEKLTYEELNKKSNQLAHYLKSKGVQQETLVPLCVERGPGMLRGILGILKAGGAYVPIDPGYPDERILYILQDIQTKIIISNKESDKAIFNTDGREFIDINGGFLRDQPDTDLNTKIRLSSLAYVIYTSGSTGMPKGVMIEHSALLTYLLNDKTNYISNKETNSGSFIHLSYTFDASVSGLFMPLICGKSLIIASKEYLNAFDDDNFYKYAPYDFIKITPSHLELLRKSTESAEKSIAEKLILGGEALHIGYFKYFFDHNINIEIINEYGPTEATVGCTTFSFNVVSDAEKIKNSISIGKPIDDTEIYIIDENYEPCPIGLEGEICIGGSNLARGYLNREELTSDKFIKNPLPGKEGERMYKTGDLGRWLGDGNIEYLGRRDDQVKVRGYRIELGEVENVLLQCPLVKQAAVMVKGETIDNMHLLGFVVPGEDYNKEDVTAFMLNKLPEYMIPQTLVEVEEFPLTSNGKIDKKALKDYKLKGVTEFVAPRNEIEEKLAEIWQNILELDQVGVHDDFFEIGGHSLLAVRMIYYIERSLSISIPVNIIFEFTTINTLGKYLNLQVEPRRK